MNAIRENISWFRGAAPYINAHRGRTFVLAFGGEAALDDGFPRLIHDIAILRALGVRLVLVHGARPQIEARLRAAGAKMHYAEGLRVTDATALAAVKEAAGCLRVDIEALLSTGLPNTPMSGARIRVASGNHVIARPLGVRNGIDYQHTGEVRRIEADAIRHHLDLGEIVLLPPIGYSPTGEVFNVTAEEIATAAAVALGADKLIFLSEPGALRSGGRHAPTQFDVEGVHALLSDRRRRLPDELRLHLDSALTACRGGVGRVHLVDRRTDGTLLLELYTREGAGLLVSGQGIEHIRQAGIEDVGGILELIRPLEDEGILVRRSREQLELEIGRFTVIDCDGMIAGCAALYPFPEEGVAELACLAVHPDYRDAGRGDRLLGRIERVAADAGIERIFVLTTRTAHWFRERGFAPAELRDLPVKRRELYNYQRNSKVFSKRLSVG